MRYQNKGQLNDIFYQTTDYLAPSHAVSTRPDTDNLKENQSKTQICKSKVVKFDIEFKDQDDEEYFQGKSCVEHDERRYQRELFHNSPSMNNYKAFPMKDPIKNNHYFRTTKDPLNQSLIEKSKHFEAISSP